ncbi:parallel beta-helix domain-containing protein [Parvularcula maris]|uniref:Right-handed parallel beta-helix repeat-containing protein n=1 Tax=Parvularcula maris TaxID=2965077 RepID=A0A9X2L7S2_9PROT|nr:parallel beta-helix domain-containing protein [Parvularcula maris]MCQ8184494.1 right-handed parallel beta-helix repeat-containing protein [Parvularcula maris]
MRHLLLGLSLVTLAACGSEDTARVAEATDESFQEELQLQLLDAKPGDVIEIPAGRYALDRGLSLTADGVTIRGAGMEETVLSFAGQVAGAEGLLVTADDFTIEDMAIEDTIGDALKINEADGVVIRRVRVEWTGEPKTENGAYGFYPVQTTNVLIEDSVAIGASDAGIYVGQSKNVVVRNNRAERNVAGIEIENTQDADVYGNVATDNTGGILVFNMPNLSQEGGRVRIYGNEVYENDLRNFGHPGTPVASIPAGSGIVINSHDDVEVFDNDIRDNRTANVIISSVYASNYADNSWSDSFDPYPERIHFHSNRLSGGGDKPDGAELKALKLLKFGPGGSFPHVLWDGYAAEGRDPQICIQDEGAKVLNADLPNSSKNISVESAPFDCSLPRLKAVRLASAE